MRQRKIHCNIFHLLHSSLQDAMDILINRIQSMYKSRAQLNMQNENNQNQYLIDGHTLINL